ncbi:hypothetical protein D3C87_2135720 [compost metagenome]
MQEDFAAGESAPVGERLTLGGPFLGRRPIRQQARQSHFTGELLQGFELEAIQP